MRRRTRLALTVLAAVGLAAAARADEQSFSQIARGRYLTLAGDCSACHTRPGGPPFAGGRPIETPFGTVVAPNITPDRDTGIGAWSDAEFADALRRGRGHGGELLYPAMPFLYYTHVTDQDVRDIQTYLKTVAPVRNKVRSNQLPFPFSVRSGMRVWDWLYFGPGLLPAHPEKSTAWNRGAYLVEGLGHCGACHTPKDWLGGDEQAKALQGGTLQGWHAPDLTSNRHSGLGAWSIDEIVAYLKTGHNAAAAAAGPMSEEVTRSSSQLSDADLRAIAIYLKDLPPSDHVMPAPIAADDPAMQAGLAIFADSCAACHKADGSGVPELFPALRGAPFVQSTDPTSLIRVVLRGGRSAVTDGAPTGPAMPAYDWKLDDTELAAVLTYVRNAWGNTAPSVTSSDVKKIRPTP